MSPKEKDQIDSLLSEVPLKIKLDKKGKISFHDMHEAIMQVRIKIQKL